MDIWQQVLDSWQMMVVDQEAQIVDDHMRVRSGRALQHTEVLLALWAVEHLSEPHGLEQVWALCLDNVANSGEADWGQTVALQTA